MLFKSLLKKFLPIIDFLLVPMVFLGGLVLKQVRSIGIQHLPKSKNTLLKIGVFPILNHYYEPQFDYKNHSPSLSEDRVLTGINWNVSGQLKFLEQLIFADELFDMSINKSEVLEFYLNNGSFESGDAEFWYQMIRAKKPNKIIEIGSGNSTLIATRAIAKNKAESQKYSCDHVCIEPYEMSWLEEIDVRVIRDKVENLPISFFACLKENDILFIDSSHVIRPQGDILYEYLQLLPTLNKGVIVHIHDIFSPKNYLREWLQDKVYFWNEQYLLEAFLTDNKEWEIIGALNYLHHNYYKSLKSVAPFLTKNREPGSFYLQKLS